MMADYATLADLKALLSIPTAKTDDDDELSAKLTAASRRIDSDCNARLRQFTLDVGATSRVYKPTHPELLQIRDISSDVGLVVEVGSGSSWSALASTQYEVLPENCVADGTPIETLRRLNGRWPTGATSTRVRVTGTHGWPAVPEDIKAATLLLAARIYRRKGSIEGAAGFGELGLVRVSRYDPDYDALIYDYVRKKV